MRSICLLSALCLVAVSSAAQEIGKIRYLAGAVTLSRAGATLNAAPGDSLQINDIVRTPSAAGTGVRIVLLDASELTLGSGTELRVVVHNPQTQQTTIEMLHGHLRAKVTPVVKQGGIFQVRTPTAVAVALGTVVEVSTVGVETATSTIDSTISSQTINSVPLNGRDFSTLALLTPGTTDPAAIDRIRGAANSSILDNNTDTASVTGLGLPSGDAISELSVTNLTTGAVTDATPNPLGDYEIQSLPAGPYNIRISTKSGSNSFHGHAFDLYSGRQINFFSTPKGAQSAGSVQSGWDYSISPSYNLTSSRTSGAWLQRFASLPSLSSNPPPVGTSLPSSGESFPGIAGGTMSLFNPQTQSFNALAPFTASSGANFTPGIRTQPTSNGSLFDSSTPYLRGGFSFSSDFRYRLNDDFRSRADSESVPSAAGSGNARNFFDAFDYPSRSHLQLGTNFTYDYNLGTTNQFSFTSSPQLTPSQNFMSNFSASTLGTNFSPSLGGATQAQFGTPPPSIQIGGFSGGRTSSFSSPGYSGGMGRNFNLSLAFTRNFAPGNAEQPTASISREGRFMNSIPRDDDWRVSPRVQLNFGLRYSASYTTGASGDDLSADLSNPTISSRLMRSLGLQSPSSKIFQLNFEDGIFRPYKSAKAHRGYPIYNFGEYPLISRPKRPKYSEYEIENLWTQSLFGIAGYKSWDSWCRRRNSKYDYKRLILNEYPRKNQYFGAYYGYTQPVAPDYAHLTLEQIEPGLRQPSSGQLALSNYTGVIATIIIALDHWVAVAGYAPGSRTQYGQSGQMIIVRAGQAAERPVAMFNPNGTTATFQPASLRNFPTIANIFGSVPEFNGSGGTCTPTYVLNGVALFGGSSAAYAYKMLGTGSSTGQVIRVLITNNTNCAIYFMVAFGSILQPRSLEHKIGAAIGLLLGGDLNVNNVKSYQIMINFGGTTIVIIFVPPPPSPQHPAIESGGPYSTAESDSESEQQLPPNVVEGFLRSYCLELHKLAPHPDTRYEFADAKLQEELGPNAAFLQRIFEMVQSGALKIPPGHSLDSLIQWTLWASRESMDQGKFMDAYMTLVHHNYEAQKRKWDKDAQKQMEESGKGLWPAVAMALAAK